MKDLDYTFKERGYYLFHKFDERAYYASAYGNYQATLELEDFFLMYISGGEI